MMTLLLSMVLLGIGLLVSIGALLVHGNAISALAIFTMPVALVAVIVMTAAADTGGWRFVVALAPMGLAAISLALPNDTSGNVVASLRRVHRRQTR